MPHPISSALCSSNVINFSYPRRMVTRSIQRRILSTFRFLDLPPELRNMIYEYCVDVTAAQKLLARYYDLLRDTDDVRSVEAPLIWSKCPTIFLINRQIHAESHSLVPRRSLTFDHGLLDLLDIKDFVPTNLLRTISSITIDDSGHPLFQENILAPSWLGYTTLIEQLSEILSGTNHNLKSFTLSLASPELHAHVTTCWHADFKCGFRDTLRTALTALRKIRNVGTVTLRGLPEALAAELKAHMESKPLSFLDLPRELRDMVYAHTGDWSDISHQLVRTMANWVDKAEKPPYPPTSTPTVLRINRQIYSEAIEVLRARPLILTFPGDHNMERQQLVPNMLRFISPGTLKHVKQLVLKLESWEWIYSLDHVLPQFASVTPVPATTTSPPSPGGSGGSNTITNTNNNISHFTISSNLPALKSIHITFNDTLRKRFLASPTHQYPDSTLHMSLGGLANLRGLQTVTFRGDLPTCYTEPLRHTMMAPASTIAVLPKLMAIKGDGTIVPAGDDDDE